MQDRGYQIEAEPRCHCGGTEHPGCKVIAETIRIINEMTKDKISKKVNGELIQYY